MRRLAFLITCFVVGGLGGIFFDRLLIPHLGASDLGKRFPALRRTAERTTVINRTEVVKIEEGEAAPDLADRIKNSIVPLEIVSSRAATAKRSDRERMARRLATGLALTNDGLILVHNPQQRQGRDTFRPGKTALALEHAASETSSVFVLLRSPEKKYFGVLPFSQGTPRLGSRVFYLATILLDGAPSVSFEPATISAKNERSFRISPEWRESGVIINFNGEVVGMAIETATGTPVIVTAGALRRLSEELLKKASTVP